MNLCLQMEQMEHKINTKATFQISRFNIKGYGYIKSMKLTYWCVFGKLNILYYILLYIKNVVKKGNIYLQVFLV